MGRIGQLQTTFTVRRLPRYRLEVWHDQLDRYSMIRGDNSSALISPGGRPAGPRVRRPIAVKRWGSASLMQNVRCCNKVAVLRGGRIRLRKLGD